MATSTLASPPASCVGWCELPCWGFPAQSNVFNLKRTKCSIAPERQEDGQSRAMLGSRWADRLAASCRLLFYADRHASRSFQLLHQPIAAFWLHPESGRCHSCWHGQARHAEGIRTGHAQPAWCCCRRPRRAAIKSTPDVAAAHTGDRCLPRQLSCQRNADAVSAVSTGHGALQLQALAGKVGDAAWGCWWAGWHMWLYAELSCEAKKGTAGKEQGLGQNAWPRAANRRATLHSYGQAPSNQGCGKPDCKPPSPRWAVKLEGPVLPWRLPAEMPSSRRSTAASSTVPPVSGSMPATRLN